MRSVGSVEESAEDRTVLKSQKNVRFWLHKQQVRYQGRLYVHSCQQGFRLRVAHSRGWILAIFSSFDLCHSVISLRFRERAVHHPRCCCLHPFRSHPRQHCLVLHFSGHAFLSCSASAGQSSGRCSDYFCGLLYLPHRRQYRPLCV